MTLPKFRPIIETWHDRLITISEVDAGVVLGSRWTRKQVLGHLIDSAANNHQRFIRLQHGDLRGFPGYDQEFWVQAGAYQHSTWNDLLVLWRSYNLQLAMVIAHLDPATLSAQWVDRQVSLEFLITDYVDHLQHHLRQIHPD